MILPEIVFYPPKTIFEEKCNVIAVKLLVRVKRTLLKNRRMMKMKKNITTLRKMVSLGMSVCVALTMTMLAGCAKTRKTVEIKGLTELKAKTEDSKYHLQGAMAVFDGKELRYSSFDAETKPIAEKLSKEKYEPCDDWDPGKVTYPIYHVELEAMNLDDRVEMTDKEVLERYVSWSAFWSNGYLVTNDGKAYKCKIDSDSVTEEIKDFVVWGNKLELMPVYDRMSALWKDRWYKENMQALDEYITRTFDGESMTVSKADGWNAAVTSRKYEEITVEVKNENVSELCSGEYFGPVFVKIDNEWYCVPSDVSNNSDGVYHDIGIMVPQGGTLTITNWRGYLPNGEYAVFVDCSKDTGVFEYVLAEFVV